MLGVASPGNLEEYKSGIELMAGRFPGHWGTIWIWDESMRSAHWSRLREEIVSKNLVPDADFQAEHPWAWIIHATRYGAPGLRWQWWDDKM